MDEETRRKLQAKRFNEHVKLLVTSVNAAASRLGSQVNARRAGFLR